MPAILNPHQPLRPSEDVSTKKPLLYRTYPYLTDDVKCYRVMEPANQLAQMQLYRWSRSDEFVASPSCADLYDYLIADQFQSVKYLPSKNHFGRTIKNALDYECRKLKGVTKDNPKACQVYYFHNRFELQYGLEYMICSWLRKFLNESAAPGAELVSGHEMVSEELDILADSSWKDYLEVYVQPLQAKRNQWEEPMWRTLLKDLHIEIDSEPEPIPEPNRRKLRSF